MGILEYIPFTDEWYEKRIKNARELLGAEISLLKKSVELVESRRNELVLEKVGLEKKVLLDVEELNVLREENNDLVGRLAEERTQRDELMIKGTKGYLGEIEEKIRELGESYQKDLGVVLRRNLRYVSKELLVSTFPAEIIYPRVIDFLIENSRLFKTAPVAVYSPRENSAHPYMVSDNFKRFCIMPDCEVSKIISENIEKIGNRGLKGYELKFDDFILTFRALGPKETDKIHAIAVYATPHKKEKKRQSKLFSSIREPALNLLHDIFEDLNQKEDYGLNEGDAYAT